VTTTAGQQTPGELARTIQEAIDLIAKAATALNEDMPLSIAGTMGDVEMWRAQDRLTSALSIAADLDQRLATYRAALELALPVLEMVVGTADPDDALDWTHMAAAAVRAALAKGG